MEVDYPCLGLDFMILRNRGHAIPFHVFKRRDGKSFQFGGMPDSPTLRPTLRLTDEAHLICPSGRVLPVHTDRFLAGMSGHPSLHAVLMTMGFEPRLAEINNGRLAMVAMAAIVAQNGATGQSLVEQFTTGNLNPFIGGYARADKVRRSRWIKVAKRWLFSWLNRETSR